ncbi:phage neck terminator protein [Fructilactobacillus florum]|uniref:phage neck terminator protein n=1 Tax=Fructilactobacillus florum TaxID=640331 RepID=UPI003F72A8D8
MVTDIIHQYEPKVPVVSEERIGKQPSYPYITYSPVVAHKQTYFNDYDASRSRWSINSNVYLISKLNH